MLVCKKRKDHPQGTDGGKEIFKQAYLNEKSKRKREVDTFNQQIKTAARFIHQIGMDLICTKDLYQDQKTELATLRSNIIYAHESLKKARNGEEKCSICLDSIEERDMIALPCGHNTFHAQCIVQHMWHQKASCPLCRARPVNTVSSPGSEEEDE